MSKLSQPAVRRAAYFAVAAVLATLVAAGLITEAQYDSWAGIVEQLLPILGTVALTVAGAKTHEGSDDPTTQHDLQLAYQSTQPVPEPSVVDVAYARARDASDNAADALESARAAYRDATRRD